EASRDPRSFVYCWKEFCSRYFHNWCHENAPCSLLLDSSNGAIGIIRKSSVSLLCRLTDTEILSYGTADEIREININLSSDLEREVLLKVLWCTRHLSEHLGKVASVIFYDCCFNKPLRSPESIMMRIVKVLATFNVLERGPANHKTNTNFSMDMLVSLRELYSVAGTWDVFVEVGLMYLNFLVYQRNQNGSDSGLVFESIFTILLLLNYMLKISAQIYMSPEDVSTVQVRLIRPTQQIIMEWNKPSHLPVVEDFISEFSLLQTDSSTNQRSLDLGLRKRAPRGTSSASE
nr:hypothetical protein [Tanacetum cinerariifolium]